MWRKSFARLPLIAVATVGLCAQNVQAQTILHAPRAVEWKDFLGINVQFQYFSPHVYEKQMARLDQLGLKWIRLTMHWAALEPEQAHYSLADLDQTMSAIDAHHYDTVASVVGSAPFNSSAPAGASNSDQYPPKDFNVFAEHMVMLARRYPHVNNWQVWNEPNIVWLPQEDPQAYEQLLTTSANAVRAAAPDKTIVTAGMAYYGQMRGTDGLMLDKLLGMGLGNQNIVAAYHPYSDFPEGDSVADRDFLTRATLINSNLHSRGVKQVWATEWGWSSYTDRPQLQGPSGLDKQADYTLRRLALMSAMDYQRVFLFNLSDLDSRVSLRDQFYGLLNLQGDPKPVYTVLRNFLTVTGPRLEPADPPAMNNAPTDLYAMPWTRSDGTHLLMFWSADGTSVQLPGVKSAAILDPLAGTRTVLADEHGITLTLKPSLQMLIWR